MGEALMLQTIGTAAVEDGKATKIFSGVVASSGTTTLTIPVAISKISSLHLALEGVSSNQNTKHLTCAVIENGTVSMALTENNSTNQRAYLSAVANGDSITLTATPNSSTGKGIDGFAKNPLPQIVSKNYVYFVCGG